MKFPRILQIAVCLVLCVCLVFSMATPRAKALAVVDDIAIGITALLLLAAAGVVFTPKDSDGIASIGNSFQSYMYQWGTSAEKLDEVEEFFTGLTLYSPNNPDDGDQNDDGYVSPNERKVYLARGILTGITAWIGSVILAGKLEVETEIPEGYASYNGVILPIIPIYNENQIAVLSARDSGLYDLYICYSYDSSAEYSIKQIWDSVYGVNYYFCSSSNSSKTVYNRWFSFDSSSNEFDFHFSNSSTGSVTLYRGSSPNDRCSSVFWSSVDVVDLFTDAVVLYGSDPVYSSSENVYCSSFVGDLPGQIQNGEASADDIVLPDALDYGALIQDGQTLEQSVISTMDQLAQGTITYEDFLEDITVQENIGTDTESGTLGQIQADTFWDKLAQVVTAPLVNLFVPSSDYLTEKVEAIRSEFSFADSIIATGELFGRELQDVTTEPPIVYIDLAATRGSYDIGDRMPFVDLTWYAEYKPTGDAVISAFMWAIFAWRIFQKLPGIISGMPGDFVMTGLQETGLSRYLPSRKKEYEQTRRQNRRL